MTQSRNNQIPRVRPAQFESDVSGVFNDSVNLFRGDVNLSLDLVSLKGRNGLDVKVTALYGSNVKGDIHKSNLSAPTGILGLGWHLPFDRIQVDTSGNASVNDNIYYLYTNNAPTELVGTTMPWRRTALPHSDGDTLNQGKLNEKILARFIDSGLTLDGESEVDVVTPGKHWIIRDQEHQRTFDARYEPLNIAVYAGGEAFECFNYDFSRILYYPEYERWELVKDDGTSYFYGGNATDQNPIQWQVRWGNWTGDSALTQDGEGLSVQSRFPVAWNLVSVETVWGDAVAFHYDTVEQAVGDGGASFTKACYISKITDMFGRTIDFNYGEKEYNIQSPSGAREYMASHWDDPYTKVPDDQPSAYQDRYETRYLDNLVVRNQNDVMLYTVQLGYDATASYSGYALDNNLYGDTVKRTLTRIQRIFADNGAMPALDFSYWPAGSVNAGAMSGAVTPDGARISYEFKQQTLPLCHRQKEISNPWPGSAKPRVWFGPDYVVGLWLNESTDQIQVTLYSWLGRWQQWNPDTRIIQAAFDIDSVNVLATDDFACLCYTTPQSVKSYVHVFHKDNREWGEWLETDAISAGTTNLGVAAGSNFFVACDRDNRTLMRYTWDCFSKQWIIENVSDELAGGSPNGKPYVAASNKHYAILDYGPESGGTHHNRLSLHYQDGGYQWHDGASENLDFTIGGYNPEAGFGFQISASFIALTYITHEVSLHFDYTVKVIGWDDAYQNITDTDFAYGLPKSSPSKTITIPFIAWIVNNSMIASGPNLLRYNGATWLKNSALDFRPTCSDQDINWFAYGTDYAIHTSNREYAVQSKLAGYDADTDITSWNRQGVDLYTKDDSTPDRKRHYFPAAGGDIATMGNRVYHRGSKCNWETAVTDYQELPWDIDSTTMINQGPRFISYLNIENSTAQNTTIRTLVNQMLDAEEIIDQRYFTQINTDGSIKKNTKGQFPSGLSTFVTYLPLNKNFDDAQTITLNRYLDNALEGAVVDYCVEAMHVDDGYTTNTTKYVFDIATAACDPTGAVVKYYKSTYYPGVDSAGTPAHGWTENHYFNGLTRKNTVGLEALPEAGGEASGLLDGQLIEQKTFDGGGKLLIHDKKDIQSFTAITVDGTTFGLFGGFTRCMTNTNTSDGLTVATDYQYDDRFGKVIMESYDNITVDGATETIRKQYGYAYEVYPWFVEKNVIDVPYLQYGFVSTPGESNNGKLLSGSLQQYTPWQRQYPGAGVAAPTIWDTGNSYVLPREGTVADLPLPDPIKTDINSHWRQVNRVLARTFHGMITSQEDITDQVETTLWDINEILPVATFTCQGQDACDFVGFEPYEPLSGWQLTNGENLSNDIVSGDAYTGSRSFNLTPGKTLKKTAALQQSQTTVIFAWVKAEKGFHSDKGSVYLEVTAGEDPTQTFAIEPAEEATWQYWQAVVNGDSGSTRSLAISIANQKTTAGLLINNICAAPLASEIEAICYDLVYSDTISNMGPNADVRRYGYDLLRRKFAESGPWENARNGWVNYNTRDWHDPTPYVYPQDRPSGTLEVMAAGGGLYETFTNGPQVWNDWQRDNPEAWRVTNGRLRHDGTSLDTVTWGPTEDTGAYAVGLTPSSPDTTGLSFIIAIGDAVTATWQSEQGWRMTLDGATHTDSTVNGKVPSTVLLLPMNGAVLLFADGRQVFAVQSQTVVAGKFSLSAQGALRFANPVTYLAPQASMTYKNANRGNIQTQVLNGTQCLVKEYLYNPLGNVVAETKIASFDNTLLGYRGGFVTGLDKGTGVMTGEISEFYPEDQGYPYHGVVYEASSLGRPLVKGLPGKDFAVTGGNDHTTRFCYEVTGQDHVAGITYRPGEFLVTAVTDANGSAVYTIKDRRGQTLGKQTNAGDTRLDAVRQVFDSAGNISQILHPNYFSKREDAGAFVTRNRYDFLGQLMSRTTQDAGETKYIYDPAGRIRFSSTPLTVEKKTVLYKKYDSLGRIYEEGEMTGDWGDGSALQAIADSDPHYPADNSWDTRNIYDGPGDTVTLRGRLWKTQKRAADNGIVENVYAYDHFGNATQCILNLPGQSSLATTYAYNNLGQTLCIGYPDGAPVHEVMYAYNDLGQNVAIGTADEPGKFAQYRYNADGSLAQEALNNTEAKAIRRTMTYNSPGWITEINNQYGNGDSILKHHFTYTSGGYEDAGYYNGDVAGAATENAVAPAHSFEYRFRYDPLGRMDVARHVTNPAYSLGVGTPITFDPNGNILSLPEGDTVLTYQYQKNCNKVDTVTAGGGKEQRYGYDAVGNVTSASYRHIASISYNPLNNLPLSVTAPQGDSLTFTYNGINQRVIKSANSGQRIVYVHGFGDSPLMELNEEITQYIHGVGGLLAMVRGDTSSYLLKDQQGSIRAVVEASGQVKTMLDYMPFGQLLPGSYGDPEVIRYRYAGQEFDAELGLYNYLARFYDPQLGRFYSCDPKFQYGSPYAYCGNNPANRTDPSGEIATILIILIVGAVIGAAVGAGAAAYTGWKAGLKGGALAGYIVAGAAVGAVAGALSAAGGVGAFAAGSAAAAVATTTAGGIVAGITAGAGVGAVVGAGIGAAQGVSQHFINDAFGVENSGTWQQSLLSGAITGAIGGAIAGGVAGVGGALAVQQSARYLQLTGNNGWAYSPRSLTQVSEAYSSFGKMGVIPLPSFVSRIPNVNLPVIEGLQTFVLSKFSLPTISSAVGALAKQAVSPLLPTTSNGQRNDTAQNQAALSSPMPSYYGQQAYNPAMSGSIGMQSQLVLNPVYWNNNVT